MKSYLLKLFVGIALLSVIIFTGSVTAALAAAARPVVEPAPARLQGGQGDNDHTPIYGPNGELLYPLYEQPQSFTQMAAAVDGPGLPCGLSQPVADGRYGDLKRDDNWARVDVNDCPGKLAGVAWSAWPGRNPIATGHDQQDLWIKIKIRDLTTGKTVQIIDRHVSNNPREVGVLYYTYEFELPDDGHQYELHMSAKMRQHTCRNGSGKATDSATVTSSPRQGVAGLLKLDESQQPLAGAIFELVNLPEFASVTEAYLTSDRDGRVWASVAWRGGPEVVTGQFCETQAPAGYFLPAEGQRCIEARFVNGNLSFPDHAPSLVNAKVEPECNGLVLSIPKDSEIQAAGTSLDIVVNEVELIEYYRVVLAADGEVISGPQSDRHFPQLYVYPDVTYQVELSVDGATWIKGCTFSYHAMELAACTLTSHEDKITDSMVVNLGARDEAGNNVDITHFKADSNFAYDVSATSATALPVLFQWPGADKGSWFVQFEVSADNGQTWINSEECRLEYERTPFTTGQYQDFIGAVAFGTFTPYLEPGKEYFDGARSVMFNVEYLTGAGQGDVVFRFNGQEVDDVTTSVFHSGDFQQLEAEAGRAVTTLGEGVTKLIAYRYGAEQARIFQSVSPDGIRWIHPLDQPFEHKYQFGLELHGPAGVTDVLVYGDEVRQVQYDQNGIVVVELTYDQPGLVALYAGANTDQELAWNTVGSVTYPITTSQTMIYQFDEIGLYHYRLLNLAGQVVVSSQTPNLQFTAEPEITYQAQLAYPVTSLFVGLYDDMKFEHPDYWTMPVDGRSEHAFEFHLDYHRFNDPDLGNDHIRGDMVVDGLTLSYGTTSVAQQFPYGRHDGARPGVNIVGIPDVSMVAFCQRPGYHEVVYWGGWENESYYLPDRGWIFDQELADDWNEDQQGDCIDAARRVNMELARQGLRTDHTYRHHGERSQGYQMVQQHIWSAYNLAGMRPPHVGQIFKPGTVLAYYENVEDLLFWGWDLNKGGLADGINTYELQKYVASLGPAQYVDMTGIHPAEAVFVPQMPALEPAPAQPITEPTPVEPTIPGLPTTEPATPETPAPTFPMPEPPAPTPTIPESPTPTPAPPILEPAPAPLPTT